MTDRHTQGPWVMAGRGFGNTPESNCFLRISTSDPNKTIAYCSGYDYTDHDRLKEERRANARLIASAPELLEALDYLNNFICSYRKDARFEKAYSMSRSALAKATGR